MTRREKVIWIVGISLLTILELKMIMWSDADAAKEREYATCQMEKNFESIEAENQQQFAATTCGLEEVIKRETMALGTENKTLTETMGGTSFPLFIATLPNSPAGGELPVHVMTPGKYWPRGHVPTAEETAPLADVTVDLMEAPHTPEEFTQSAMESMLYPTHYNLGTIMVPGMFVAPFKLEAGKRYDLLITTRRGLFREEIYIKRDPSAPGGWAESSCTYVRQTVHKHGTTVSEEKLLTGKCD
jgi:hypothetical protein